MMKLWNSLRSPARSSSGGGGRHPHHRPPQSEIKIRVGPCRDPDLYSPFLRWLMLYSASDPRGGRRNRRMEVAVAPDSDSLSGRVAINGGIELKDSATVSDLQEVIYSRVQNPVQSSDDTETLTQLKSTGLQYEIPEVSEINNHYGDTIAVDDQTVADSTLFVNGIDHDSSKVEKAGTSIDFEISHFDDVENINEGNTGSKESSSLLQKRTEPTASRKKIVKLKAVKPSILSVQINDQV